MKFEVTILGSSSATPVFNRNPTAQLLNCNEKIYLIDCGEGTQQQMIRFGLKASKIDAVFISHLHGDHYFGLIGLLSTMHLNGRIKPFQIFAPPPLKEILEMQFRYSDTILRYEIDFIPTTADAPAKIFENQDMVVETIILNHRIPTTGFKFTEKKRQRKLRSEKLEADNIPLEYYPLLKRGLDLELPGGRIIANADYTIDSDAPKCYCYCSDTLADGSYLDSIRNCTMLYHEATFLDELLDRANMTHHTTALQAGSIAKDVGAGKLLIGHFSSRYKTLLPLLEEASGVFANTELALEGNTYSI
ncbi:ribonuclease Z [Pedobacter hartonius]|uniref:Ribonuclease Z n=1 Tax=Pedobacter hartonius TaxID=425514 RepID=A0A1H4H0X8_9SPHI|nr:ribonuclease Z [Pedobacter hartonius]SEB15495.1 ribonuclease Z [Pedobacter hartonius]